MAAVIELEGEDRKCAYEDGYCTPKCINYKTCVMSPYKNDEAKAEE